MVSTADVAIVAATVAYLATVGVGLTAFMRAVPRKQAPAPRKPRNQPPSGDQPPGGAQ